MAFRTLSDMAGYLAREIEPPPFPTRAAELLERPIERGYAKHDYRGTLRVEGRTVFLLSPGRSGSTLLRAMMGGHPEIEAPPELNLIFFDNLREREAAVAKAARTWMGSGLYQALARQKMGFSETQAFHLVQKLAAAGTPIPKVYRLLHLRSPGAWLLDKSPSYASKLLFLQRAESMCTNPRFVYLTRHPFATMESFIRMRFFRIGYQRIRMPLSQAWHHAEKQWTISHRNIQTFLKGIPRERWHRVAYEDLMVDPEGTLRQICSLLDLEFHPDMLNPYGGDRLQGGLGDPNLLKRTRLEPSLAHAWKDCAKLSADWLHPETVERARVLGYDLTPPPGGH